MSIDKPDTREGFFNKHRIEALSDGIFAIVMTLLVLELKVPEHVASGQLWEVLKEGRADWLAFLITFFISARYWMLQHNIFKLTDNYSHQALVATFAFLGLVTILPFSTSLVGRYASEHVSLVIYCVNQCLIGVSLIVKLEYLVQTEHISTDPAIRPLRIRLYALALAMGLGAICSAIFPTRYSMFAPVLVLVIGRRFFKDAK